MSGVFSAKRLSRNFDPIAPITRHASKVRDHDDDKQERGTDDDTIESMFEPHHASHALAPN
jgi:hypothetical protein